MNAGLPLPETVGGWVAVGLAVLAMLVSVVDVWLYFAHGEAATVSAVIREVAHRYPAVPLAVGLLLGHLFL
jgi:hypothetical protein